MSPGETKNGDYVPHALFCGTNIQKEVLKKVNYYENAVIFDDTLPEADLRAAMAKVKGVMEEAGGQILKVDEWGMRKLAYELNKRKKGFYVFYSLKAPSGAVHKLEEYYKIYDPVMKYMVIRLSVKQARALEAGLQAATAAAQEETA